MATREKQPATSTTPAPADAPAAAKKKRERKKADAQVPANGAEGTTSATAAPKPRAPRAKKPAAPAAVTTAPAAVAPSAPTKPPLAMPTPDPTDGPTSMLGRGQGWDELDGLDADNVVDALGVPSEDDEVRATGIGPILGVRLAEAPDVELDEVPPGEVEPVYDDGPQTALVEPGELEAKAPTVHVPRPVPVAAATSAPAVASATALPPFSTPTPPAAPRPPGPIDKIVVTVSDATTGSGVTTNVTLQYIRDNGVLALIVLEQHAEWLGHPCRLFDIRSDEAGVFNAFGVTVFQLGGKARLKKGFVAFILDHELWIPQAGRSDEGRKSILALLTLGWNLSVEKGVRKRFGIQPTQPTAPAADATSDGGTRPSTAPQGMPGEPAHRARPTMPARPPTADAVAASALAAPLPVTAPEPPRAAVQQIPLDRSTAGGAGPSQPAMTPAARPAVPAPAPTAPIVATTGARGSNEETDPVRTRDNAAKVRVTTSRKESFKARMRPHKEGFIGIHVPEDSVEGALNGPCTVEIFDDNYERVVAGPFHKIHLLPKDGLRERVENPSDRVVVILDEWWPDEGGAYSRESATKLVHYGEVNFGWRSSKAYEELFKDARDDSMLRRFVPLDDERSRGGKGSNPPPASLADEAQHEARVRPDRQRGGRKGDPLGRFVLVVIALLMAGAATYLFLYGKGKPAASGVVARVPDSAAKPKDPIERCAALKQMGRAYDANTCCKELESGLRAVCAARVKATEVIK